MQVAMPGFSLGRRVQSCCPGLRSEDSFQNEGPAPTARSSYLLSDKELFLRFPYHPLLNATGIFQPLRGGSHGAPRKPTLPNEAADEGPLGDQVGKRGSSDGVRGHHVSRRLFLPADRNRQRFVG